jgi:hypothetical protein
MDSAESAGDSAGRAASERMMEGEGSRRSGEAYRSPRTGPFPGESFPGDPDDAPSNDAVCCKNGDLDTCPPSARPLSPALPFPGAAGFRDGDAPFDVRMSSVRDGFLGVDPAFTTFRVPDTLRALPVETLRPWLILGLDPDAPRDGEADLKIELLTRLPCRTCLKLELVRRGPSVAVVVRAGEPETDAASPAGRFVLSGAHPLVEVEMMLARSLSSNRRDAEGDGTGERTLLMWA